jgi:DNA-binding response OmpR family regulator
MAKSASDKKPTVLCVDDDTHLRPLVARILEKAGFAVTQVATCAEAKNAMLKETPTVVVLDVDLPDGNGFEIAKEWRGSGQPSLPILFISGGEQTERKEKATQLNAVFLPKPFAPAALLASVTSLLNSVG